MSIRIGQKGRRGLPRELGGGNPTYQGYTNIDISANSKTVVVDIDDHTLRIPANTLAPINITGPVLDYDYNGQGNIIDLLEFHNFEIWWQTSKVYKSVGHVVWNSQRQDWDITPAYWAWRRKWSRVHKGRKNIGQPREAPLFYFHNGRRLDLISARRYYLRKYCQVVSSLPIIEVLYQNILRDAKYMIIARDGPADDSYKWVGDRYITRPKYAQNKSLMLHRNKKKGYEMDWSLIEEAIHNRSVRFSPVFIVAAILELKLERYMTWT